MSCVTALVRWRASVLARIGDDVAVTVRAAGALAVRGSAGGRAAVDGATVDDGAARTFSAKIGIGVAWHVGIGRAGRTSISEVDAVTIGNEDPLHGDSSCKIRFIASPRTAATGPLAELGRDQRKLSIEND